MGFGRILSVTDISASGLAAERLRMEVAANNIANSNSTRTPEGGAFRRKQVVFAAAYENALRASFGDDARQFRGVTVTGIQPDSSEMPRIHKPGHPDADADGFVTFPNVSLPNEMVDLITASRSYEANLRALKSFREIVQQALSLLRGA